MRFAIIAPDVPTKRWKENFERIAPKIPLLIGENTDTPEDVVCALVWKQPIGSLVKFKNLKFYKSQNETIGMSDNIRLSEIAICDVAGDILAIGKFDRQVIKKKNDFVVMDIQIVV